MQATGGLVSVVVRNVIAEVKWFMTHQCNDFTKLVKLFKPLEAWKVIVPTSQGFHENVHICLAQGLMHRRCSVGISHIYFLLLQQNLVLKEDHSFIHSFN